MTAGNGLADPPSGATHKSALSSRIASVLSASYSDLEIRDALAALDARGFANSAESRRRLRLDVQDEVIRANGEIIDDFGAVADELRHVEAILSRISTTCAALRSHVEAASRSTAPMRDEAKTLLSQKKDVEIKEAILSAFQSHFILDDAAIAALTSPSEPVDDTFFAALARLKRIHADSQVLLSSAHDRLGASVLEGTGKTLTAAHQKLFRWTQRAFRALDLENPQLGASLRRALRALAERPALFASSLDSFAATREQTLAASFHAALTGEGEGAGSKPIEMHAHDPLRYVGDMLAWAHAAAVGEREALEVLFVADGDELARGLREGAANDPWARVSSRNDDDGAGAGDEEPFDGRAALAALVARDLAGVAAELRARAAQAIQGADGAVAAFRVANLLAFYRGTFAKLLASGDSAALADAAQRDQQTAKGMAGSGGGAGQQADLQATLAGLEDAALRQFRANMADATAALRAEAAHPATDVHTPAWLRTALDTLAQLLQSLETALASSGPDDRNGTGDVEKGGAGAAALLSAALDPLLPALAAHHEALPGPQRTLATINALHAVRGALAPFPAVAKHSKVAGKLDGALETAAGRLAEHVHRALLNASGLAPLVGALRLLGRGGGGTAEEEGGDEDADDDSRRRPLPRPPAASRAASLAALRAHPALQPAALRRAAGRLDAWLPGALEEAADETRGLEGAGAAAAGRRAVARAAERFCNAVDALVQALRDLDDEAAAQRDTGQNGEEVEDGGERLREAFPRTGEEVRVLLS
jgi:hypothetical protein